MIGYCIFCKFFTPITNVVGACNELGVMIDSTMGEPVAIIDNIDTLDMIANENTPPVYNPLVVQAYFGCLFYTEKNANILQLH